MPRKPILTALLLLAAALGLAAQRPHGAYRLNKLQPHDLVVPQGDWQRSLNGMWAVQNADSLLLPCVLPHADSAILLHRDFTLPPHWQDRTTIVRFGAAGAAILLYVNGREIGYSEDSKTPAEWNISRHLRPGSNRIAVKLLRHCPGSSLDAPWNHGGITRDISLYSLPRTHITDIRITAGLDTADYRTGLLDVMVDLNREVHGGAVEVELSGHGLTPVRLRKRLHPGDWFLSLAPKVGTVLPWSDSLPSLYSLVVRLLDTEGNETERIVKYIGFRSVDIRHGLLRLNGQPLEIRGINRLEQSPIGGQYLSHAEMRRAAILVKQLGLNAVRTLQHPADEYWLHLCDSLGIFLFDEANVNIRDTALLDNQDWLNPILDRLNSMYRRDRNHPSVIAWSLGSAPDNGYCLEEAYRFLRGKDNSRPIVSPGAWLGRNTDIVTPRNPTPAFLARCAQSLQGRRPCIPLELTPRNGASLREYWDTVSAHTALQGAFLSGFEAHEIRQLFAPAEP